MIRNKEKHEIIEKLRKELGAPAKEITEIVDSQFEYIVHVMEHSGFEPVMAPYLGKFLVNPKRLQYMNDVKIRKNGVI